MDLDHQSLVFIFIFQQVFDLDPSLFGSGSSFMGKETIFS